MSIHQPLPDKIAADWPPPRWADVTSLVAVSGGADSVALLSILRRLSRDPKRAYHITIAHLNHLLRQQADADAAWVAELADSWRLPCTI